MQLKWAKVCICPLNVSEKDINKTWLIVSNEVLLDVLFPFISMIYIPGVSWEDEAYYVPR